MFDVDFKRSKSLNLNKKPKYCDVSIENQKRKIMKLTKKSHI